MSKHVIVGAGQVGGRLASELAAGGHEVVLVTRSGSGPVAGGITRIAASAADDTVMRRITQGAEVLYNCANPRYHEWERDWPPMAASMIKTAEETGAVLVTLGNLYGYGPVDVPMTEDLPLAAKGVKGRVRASMWKGMLAAHQAGRIRMTEVRGSDYFGPGCSDQSYLGVRFMPPLIAGKRTSVISDPDIPHSYTYTPDVVTALITAGRDERAWGRAWHVPTEPAVTIREVAERVCALAGAPAPRLQRVPDWVLRVMGWFAPQLRELQETRYQFDRPFVLDSSAFQAVFGVKPTPFDEALKVTVDSYRDR